MYIQLKPSELIVKSVLLDPTSRSANSRVTACSTTAIDTIAGYGASINVVQHVNHTKDYKQPAKQKQKEELGSDMTTTKIKLQKLEF